jgi:hypothetical protein
MSGLRSVNLIHFFDFYLMLMFVVGTLRRLRQYWDTANLVLRGPGRWPLLFKLVKEHRTVFMTWATVLPGLLALALSVVQLLASRLVWPEADLTLGDLTQHWLAVAAVGIVGAAMLGFDLYSIIVVGTVDRAQMEKYFDQAEYWLRSRAATVVRVFTLGFINPRLMVAVEVRKSLTEASRLLNNTLWWVSLQLGLRVAFGLAIWITWAATRGAPGIV